MRVLLDLGHVRARSGTGVYAARLAGALRDLGVEVEEARSRHRYTNLAAEAAWQARLARRARGFDVLHHVLPALGPATVPQVITVHDLSFVRVPECFNRRFRLMAELRHRRAARGAAVVVTPSQSTAADVRSRWSPEHVAVAPHGPGQEPQQDRGEGVPEGPRGPGGGPPGDSPRHFLYVGDDEPRKNLARLRAAAASAPLPLVVAGAAGETVDAARLADLHRHAAALVIPSLHEGFGLPALEAMHAGTPVLAARTAGLTEVCADAARYCDPRDVDSIAAALTEIATVAPLREELRRRGLARAAEFSWERCARAHLDAYTLAAR